MANLTAGPADLSLSLHMCTRSAISLGLVGGALLRACGGDNVTCKFNGARGVLMHMQH